jgi:CHRD domain
LVWDRWAGDRSDPGFGRFFRRQRKFSVTATSWPAHREGVMRLKLVASAALIAAPFMMFGANASATEFSTTYSGFEEVGALNAETGAIFSPGKATLDLDLNRNARTITFKLTYSGLSAPVTQSHIHFGKRHVPGGIMVFFCTNLNNGPAGTQACPAAPATVTGTITGASVIGPTAQNIPVGDFDALVAALDSDTAYGNVHTTNFPAGEIRGQIRRADEDDRR